jgi:hypothetical protein
MAWPDNTRFFPFAPNWRRPLDETFEFRAWSIPAASGREQTGSRWGNHARRGFEYSVLLRADQAQHLENVLFAWHSRYLELPHWAEGSKLTADIASGTGVLPMDTSYRSFEAGGKLVIYLNPDKYEVLDITAVTASSVTIGATTADGWPAGTRVYPLFPVMLAASISGTRHSDNLVEFPVAFECEQTSTPQNTDIGGATPLYQDEELYLGRINWAQGVRLTYEANREVLDYGAAKRYIRSTDHWAPEQRQHNWTLRDPAEAAVFRAWLGRREGIARPVYMPTGNIDFTLLDNIVSTNFYIDADLNQYGALAGAHPARRDILIQLRDGSYAAKRIVATSLQPGQRIRLSFDDAVGINATPEQVKRVSFLSLYRQAGNSTSIRWLTDRVGTVETELVGKHT